MRPGSAPCDLQKKSLISKHMSGATDIPPSTLVFSHVADTAGEHQAWTEQLLKSASGAAGFLSLEVIQPASPAQRDTVTIVRFDTQEHLKAWAHGASCTELLKEGERFKSQKLNIRVSQRGAQSPGEAQIVFQHHVQPGKENAFMRVCDQAAVREQQTPGFIGLDVLRPSAPSDRLWSIVLRFESASAAEEWQKSPHRAEARKELRSTVRSQLLLTVGAGQSTWFSAQGTCSWKQALLIVLGLYPVISLNELYGMPWILQLGLPKFVLIFLLTCIYVSIVFFISVPLLARGMGFWLAPAASRRAGAGGLAIAVTACAALVMVFLILDQ